MKYFRTTLVLLAVATGVLWACRPSQKSQKTATGTASPPKTPPTMKYDTPKITPLRQGAVGNSETEQNYVIKSAAEWEKVWKATNARYEPIPPMPAVDFSKYWVVACMMGAKGSGGHSVSVGDPTSTADVVTIAVKHSSPGKGCMSTDMMSYPYAFALIDHYSQAKTEFKVSKEVKDCN